MAGVNGHSNGTPNGKHKPERGRPSKYTQAIADEICRRIALGESLRAICTSHKDDATWPDDSTVRAWYLEDREGFSKHYARAQDERAERWAEEIVEIADDGSNDYMERRNSDGSTYTVLDSEHVQRSRLRVDTRKWLLAKVLPKKYGDRLTVGGDSDHPLRIVYTDESSVRQGRLHGLDTPAFNSDAPEGED